MRSGKIAVFGVPSSAGGRSTGTERAGFALREAGLLRELKGRGATVVNLSDLSYFPYRDDPDHPQARNAEVVSCAVAATADEMTRALTDGFPVVLGGGCAIVPGLVAGAARHLGRSVGLVYIDADADLNTPETSPSGILDGMGLAMALGRGPVGVAADPPVDGEHVALLGFRALDPGERPALGGIALALPAEAVRELGPRVAAALALDAVLNDDGPVLVHLDVDVIDPGELPVRPPATPGRGLSADDAGELVRRLLLSDRVIGLEVCGYDPSCDPDAAGARRIVEIVTRAVAGRLRPA